MKKLSKTASLEVLDTKGIDLMRRLSRRVIFGVTCLILAPAQSGYSASAPLPGTQVVDSKGKLVGPYSPYPSNSGICAAVVVKVNGAWYQLPVLPSGFATVNVSVVYLEPNCEGTAYVGVGPHQIVMDVPGIGNSGVINDVLYYPTPGPGSYQLVCFVGNLDGTDCGNEPTCVESGTPVTTLSTFNLSELNLISPFQLK